MHPSRNTLSLCVSVLALMLGTAAAFGAEHGWVNIGAANQSNDERLISVLEIEGLAADERFQTNARRLKYREVLAEILTARLMERTTVEWLATFDAIGLPLGPVLEVAEAVAHEQTVACGMIVETEHPSVGRVRGLGLPIHFSDGRRQQSLSAPLLGEHTEEVLREYEFTDERIRALRDDGAILGAVE
jgi:crotonobetainyl-CoA:carnitine CoA-transferase CaiB-like acyl-CoA transferase